eukprot:409384-Amphidinium_carterae.1
MALKMIGLSNGQQKHLLGYTPSFTLDMTIRSGYEEQCMHVQRPVEDQRLSEVLSALPARDTI